MFKSRGSKGGDLDTRCQAVTISRADADAAASRRRPVQIMKLVEIVADRSSRSDCVESARHFVERRGRVALVVREWPGFASPQLSTILGLEATPMVEQGVASARDISYDRPSE